MARGVRRAVGQGGRQAARDGRRDRAGGGADEGAAAALARRGGAARARAGAAGPAVAAAGTADGGTATGRRRRTGHPDLGRRPQFGVKDPRLVVARGGATLFDASPIADGRTSLESAASSPRASAHAPLQVVDLDGDGEPEVLVDAYTGGAHCCALTEILRFTGDGVRLVPKPRGATSATT